MYFIDDQNFINKFIRYWPLKRSTFCNLRPKVRIGAEITHKTQEPGGLTLFEPAYTLRLRRMR